MRLLLTLLFLASLNCVFAKNNVKSLTESQGQEIIEIGGPVKDLPPDLEEEPSAELEEDILTSTTLIVATKKEPKKTTPIVPERRKNKDYSKMEDDSKQDDEEMRIEKELADIYKDSMDYKADSSEATVKVKVTSPDAPPSTRKEEKPIARARASNFKFQPDVNNRAEVERFRTSVDEITCEKRMSMLKEPEETPHQTDRTSSKNDKPSHPKPNSATRVYSVQTIFFAIFATAKILRYFL